MNFKQAAIPTIQFFLWAGVFIVPGNADDKPMQTIAGWMSVTDPDKDCEFRLLGDKLGITVPAKNHNLHPVRGLNAPRVLKKVSGDFTVQVKVTSDFTPGKKSTKPQGQGQPFISAGILIWQSEENYLRIERNAYWAGESLYCFPPGIEYWRNRAFSGFNDDPTDATYFVGRSTWLKGRRQGPNVTVSLSHNGKEWYEVKTFQVEMADEVSVGVAAVNSSDIPFTVDFEEFTIESK
jgi:regulation of enolase protein 1 (concanavalin A-like superfamily)